MQEEKNDLHEQILQSRRYIRHSMVLALAALFAIVCVCTAWFISNRRTAAGGATVETAGIGFELASTGGDGAYDPILQSDLLGENAGWHLGVNFGDSGKQTSSALTQINWLMSADSNLNNAKDSGDLGIYPGASGKLTFYVIPAQDGDLTVSFYLTLSAYQETTTESADTITVSRSDTGTKTVIEEITTDGNSENTAPVLELMKGHILFFETYSNGKYDDLIENDSFMKTFKDAKNGEAQEVTIYWVWPYVVGQMLLPDGSATLGANQPLFTEAVRKKLCADMLANKQRYFFADETGMLDGYVSNDTITKVMEGSFVPSEYTALSRYFNLADQKIGESARYVLVQLNAQT